MSPILKKKFEIFREIDLFPTDITKLIFLYDKPNPFAKRWKQFYKICKSLFKQMMFQISKDFYYPQWLSDDTDTYSFHFLNDVKNFIDQLVLLLPKKTKPCKQHFYLFELELIVLSPSQDKLQKFKNYLLDMIQTKPSYLYSGNKPTLDAWMKGEYNGKNRDEVEMYQIPTFLKNQKLFDKLPTEMYIYYLCWRGLRCASLFLCELAYQFVLHWGIKGLFWFIYVTLEVYENNLSRFRDDGLPISIDDLVHALLYTMKKIPLLNSGN